MSHPLPPGQVEVAGFPRFGAHLRQPPPPLPANPVLRIGGPLVPEQAVLGPADLACLPRHEVTADFHCVAGWSATGLRWGGLRFAEAYDALVAPHLAPGATPVYVTALGLDGWRATICLEDLLTDDVLLADELDGRPLAPEHGGPLRLVSPAQYGFMSVKHLSRLELHETDPGWPRRVRVVSPHPRARVAREERRADLPGVPPAWRQTPDDGARALGAAAPHALTAWVASSGSIPGSALRWQSAFASETAPSARACHEQQCRRLA